jgi:hypothetical protein
VLVIREEQMAAFAVGAREQFVAHAVARLRVDEPEIFAAAPDVEVTAFVRHGLARAEAHGITESALVLDFLTCMAWLGPDFESRPDAAGAARILADPAQTPEHKVARLEDYVMSEWEGAEPCP